METPNPFSRRFILQDLKQPLLGEDTTINYGRPMEAIKSPLANKLFDIDTVVNVMLAQDSVTLSIQRQDDLDDDEIDELWQPVKLQVFQKINEHLSSGQPAVDEDAVVSEDTMICEDDDEIVASIKEILETRVRPVVRNDGGDIRFINYDDPSGVVYLELTGSCKGCPSSSDTLKYGIENMLTHYIPEVAEVRQVVTEQDKASEEALKKLEGHL